MVPFSTVTEIGAVGLTSVASASGVIVTEAIGSSDAAPEPARSLVHPAISATTASSTPATAAAGRNVSGRLLTPSNLRPANRSADHPRAESGGYGCVFGHVDAVVCCRETLCDSNRA